MARQEGLATPRSWSVPLAVWAGLSALVVAVQHLSNKVLRDPAHDWRWVDLPYLLGGLQQYDGVHYADIAANGYGYTEGVQSTIVWFPLYPLAMRALAGPAGGTLQAGVAISLLSSAVALVAYDAWVRRHLAATGAVRTTALLCLAVYPYAWFLYGVVYADGLFLALALGAYLAVPRHRVLAGVLGALATATRSTGVAVVPALLLLAAAEDGVLVGRMAATTEAGRSRLVRLGRRVGGWAGLPERVRLDRVTARTVAPLLASGGVLAYAAYLWWAFGDPLIFLTNQSTFHGGDLALVKYGLVYNWVHVADNPTYAVTTTAQTLVALAILASAPAVSRRFGLGYGVYCALLVAFPALSTSDFHGSGRYLIAAFPAFALLGERLARRPIVAGAVLATSLVLLTVGAFGFSRSWYLS